MLQPVDITEHLIETQKILKMHRLSFPSLRKFLKLGWLPEPKLRSYDGARGGRSLWWPRSVLSRLEIIRTLKNLKKTDVEITQILKGEKI